MESKESLLILFFLFSLLHAGQGALTESALLSSQKMMKNMCKRSSGVKQELLTKMRAGEFVEDQKLKCYMHCCLGMMKTMKKDKITVSDATKQAEMLLPTNVKIATLKQLNACKDVEGANACDKAFNFVKCCVDVDPTNWLIPG